MKGASMPELHAPPDLSLLSDADAVKEVYAWSGLALYYAQVLEHALVNLILVATGDAGDISGELEDWDHFFEKYFRKMLSKLIKVARERADIDDSLGDDLETARIQRNYLAHEFFRTHAADFLHAEGKQRMVRELHGMISQFQLSTERLDELTFEVGAAHGITESLVHELFAEMLNEDSAS